MNALSAQERFVKCCANKYFSLQQINSMLEKQPTSHIPFDASTILF